MITINKGINLPISGGISDTTIHNVSTKKIALIGEDYIGLKPTMLVNEGDKVSLGQALFEDKKNPGVFFCAPAAGTVTNILRGERRSFLALIIEVEQTENKKVSTHGNISQFDREALVDLLCRSGLWTLFRSRPFDKIPRKDAIPHAIFVNTMDSNPLSFDPLLALKDRVEDYQTALEALCKLTEGKIHISKASGKALPIINNPQIVEHEFAGIHPAGLVGTHIHFIEPVGAAKSVWHISLQDLLMLGQFLREGILNYEKIVAIAGPSVKNPKLVKTNRGANLEELLADNLQDGEQRIISGSVFSGRQAAGNLAYLSAYDQQVSVLAEGRETYFLRFFNPGCKFYSKTRSFLGRFLSPSKLVFNTSQHGSPRPIVPIGIYEDVMPLDILPTLLVKALVVKDTDTAVNLGALELVEEDVALLSYVDSGKHDFGAILRENLTLIEQEG